MAPDAALLLHGTMVLCAGVVSGVPFWLAILGHRQPGAIRAWRVAHTTLISAGLMLLVVGILVPHVAPSPSLARWLRWSLVASGYGFAFALIVGAAVGERGLDPFPPGANSVLFLGHAVGAIGSMAGLAIFVAALLT